MFQFVGLSAFSGEDCLDCAPSQVTDITVVRLKNAIFDRFNLTKNVTEDFTSEQAENWEYDTVLDTSFNGNIDAGNVEYTLSQITEIKIKRRVRGTFDWLTIGSIPINQASDLTFTFEDRTNTHNVEYEYALVPVLNNAEGNYIINSVLSTLAGVFIGDMETCYKFLYQVQYGSNARKVNVGTFQPLGSKYPIVISNGQLSYDTGTITGLVLNDDFEKTGILDSKQIADKKARMKNFLSDYKAKILRDWQGQKWLVAITDDIQITYADQSSLQVPSIAITWTEIGDADSQNDLYNNGIIDAPS